MDIKKKLEFEFEGQKLIVKLPTTKQKSTGSLYYGKAFNEALKFGSILRSSLNRYLVEQGIVTVEKQKELLELITSIHADREKLADKDLSSEDGEMLALKIQINIRQYELQTREMNRLDENTAEAKGDNERFNYYVSVCTLKDDGKPYFVNFEDYIERSEDPITLKAAYKLSELLYQVDENEEENRPENVYLAKLREKSVGEVEVPKDVVAEEHTSLA